MSVHIGEGPTYVSYSSFCQYLRCGKSWQLARLLEVREDPAWFFAGGSAVHTATEIYDRAQWEAGVR